MDLRNCSQLGLIGHQETASRYTLHGIKGGGEGGRMMAPAAVASAIDDALAQFGVGANVLRGLAGTQRGVDRAELVRGGQLRR